MIKVLLVDDQRLVRNCMRVRLESDPEIKVLAEVGSGEEARQSIRDHDVDIVLMDLNMPGMGGVEATRRLVANGNKVRILGVSMYVDNPYPGKFLESGGYGYISKDASSAELIKAVKKAYNGEPYISPDVASYIAYERSRNGDHLIDSFTPRKLQVWKMITDGLGVADIAKQLNLSQKTVFAHRKYLLEKLNVKNDVQLARLARENGLVY